MESTNTPITGLTEPIYNSSQSTPENSQKNENDYSDKKDKFIIPDVCLSFSLIILIMIGIAFITLTFYLFSDIITILIFLIVLIFYIFFKLYNIIVQIEVTKKNNKIYVNEQNIFFCNKAQLNGDIHFYYAIEITEDTETKHFFIINDIKDSIDLDTTEIKQKPAKLFHHLTLIMNKRNIEEILNNFEHSSDNYENPLLFDIVNYMGKNTNNLVKDLNK